MRAHHVIVDHLFAKPPERIFAYLSEHENLGGSVRREGHAR